MKKIFIAGLLFCILFLPSIGCKQKAETKSAINEPAVAVVAKVNNKEITISEFNDSLKDYPSLAHDGTIDAETKKGFLDNLIVRELLFQEAIHNGIDKEKATALFIEEMKKRILVDKIFKKEVDEKVNISEDELKKYYTEHPEEIKNPDEIRASHILLKTHEEAETIRKKLKGGLKFEEAAKKFSIDTGSKNTGGDLGFFSKGMMVPEFEGVAFNLKAGEISDIVQTRFGFHIIKLLEKKEGKQKSFDEAKQEIEKKLLSNKRKERFDIFVAELKSKAKININNDTLLGAQEKDKGKEDEK